MERVMPYKFAAEQFYYEMAGKCDAIDVKIAPFTSYAAAIAKPKSLYLHPFTCLRPEDLPPRLRVKGPDDPRLKSKSYFRRLKSWLAKTFEIDPKKLTNLENVFDMHLRIWKRPHLINRIKRFALAHEVGHIFHGHETNKWDPYFSFTFSLLITVILFELLPLYIAFLTSIIVSDISRRAFKALREYSEQYQEKEADIAALQVTRDLPAAKAFFEALEESYQCQWNSKCWSEKILTALFATETLFHISHPHPETRIQYLQNQFV